MTLRQAARHAARLLLLGCASALLPVAQAQQDSELPPSAQNLLDAPPPRPERVLPTPMPPENRRTLEIENADSLRTRQVDGLLIAEGNVRLVYRGYRVTCDRATFDRERRVGTFEGAVALDTGVQMVYADYVQVDGRTQEFLAREGRTVVPPEFIGPEVIQPVLIQGKTLSRRGEIITATHGQLTTCDFPNPHYKIGFRQADIIPNNRVVIRDATLYRYNTALARVKYLVIPVRERARYSYLPFIGRTNEEGWFVKVALGYALSQTLPGILRLDLMEKKGIGIGADQAYRVGQTGAGVAYLYTLQDQNRGVRNLNGRLSHQQYLGEVVANIATDFQQNSYQSLSSDSETGQLTVNLSRSVGPRNSDITITQNISRYPTSSSRTTAYTITQTERLSATSNVTFRLNGSDSTNRTIGATTGREEQIADVKATARLGAFNASFTANRSLVLRQKGLTGPNPAFSGTQRLPELTLSADTAKLPGLLGAIPGNLTLGYGRFLENILTFTGGRSGSREALTGRFLFEFTPRDKTAQLTPGGGLTLNLGGYFRQLVYREDAAQYILSGRTQLVQRLGENSSFNVSYNYLRPYGGAPPDFRLDQTGSNNLLNTSLSVNTYRTKASLITGYDIQEARLRDSVRRRRPWQNLALQLAFRPSDQLQTRFTTAYDINSGRLLDATNRIRLRGRPGGGMLGEGFALDTGIRYDPRRNRFPQITEVLTLPLFSRDLTLNALAGYNGITHRFDYSQFFLTQSFHDYDLIFSYINQPFGFRTERGFNVTFRLRAFPTLRPSPTGQFGTPLDTGTGEVF